MLIDLFNESWKELEAGANSKGHPFKICSLATLENSHSIRQRTVIFRGLTQERNLLFYSDIRSSKIKQLEQFPSASVLFYNEQAKLQLFVRGIIRVHIDDELWQDHKMKIDGRSINDYNTKLPPGKPIKNPIDISRTKDLNFTVLEMIPQNMEYLKLRAEPYNVRASFKKNGIEWEKTYLVP